MDATKVLEWIGNCTSKDVAEIEKSISALELQINRLRKLRKVMLADATSAVMRPETQALAIKLANHIAKVGPTMRARCKDVLGIADGSSMMKVLKCGWFDATPKGYVLSKEGKDEFFNHDTEGDDDGDE